MFDEEAIDQTIVLLMEQGKVFAYMKDGDLTLQLKDETSEANKKNALTIEEVKRLIETGELE